MSAGAPRQLTRRALVAGLGSDAAARDAAVLNLALALEHLQAAFYTEAERLGALGPVGTRVAEAIGGVERAHVAALTAALGARAAVPPRFVFGRATTDDDAFVRTAVALEDLAAATHQGQLPRIAAPAHRALLASIQTVDAGHAAWIRLLAGVSPVVHALDDPVAASDATALLLRSGLVSPRPGTPPGGPWGRAAPAGPRLLAAFPLGRRPRAERAPAPAPARSPDGLPWGALFGTTAVLSALVLGGIGLRARHGWSGRRVIVVGADEGPAVSQVAADPSVTQTAGVPPPARAPRERI